MAIEIVFKKIISGKGEELVQVAKVKALPKEKLPKEYLDGDEHLYQEGNYLVVVGDRYQKNFRGIFGKGDVMDIRAANIWMKRLQRCGDALHVVNDNKKRVQEWHGNIHIKI